MICGTPGPPEGTSQRVAPGCPPRPDLKGRDERVTPGQQQPGQPNELVEIGATGTALAEATGIATVTAAISSAALSTFFSMTAPSFDSE